MNTQNKEENMLGFLVEKNPQIIEEIEKELKCQGIYFVKDENISEKMKMKIGKPEGVYRFLVPIENFENSRKIAESIILKYKNI